MFTPNPPWYVSLVNPSFAAPPAQEEMLEIHIAGDPEVMMVQGTLMASWNIVREEYVDDTFNSQDWIAVLADSMNKAAVESSPDKAFDHVKSMIASLGDPFTRIVPPREYQEFVVGTEGSLEGVGLVVGATNTGSLVVVAPIDGGPAARAGIQTGDELVEINDAPAVGIDVEEAATRLRGESGTFVNLKLKSSGSPESGAPPGSIREVSLRREPIVFHQVYAEPITHTTPTGERRSIGYIHLTSFSGSASEEMYNSILDLKSRGVDSFILDLRANPGGIVSTGLEIASMWLDGGSTVVHTVDRYGTISGLELMEGSKALAGDEPMVVLVDGGTASASEILASALQDNQRALVMGETTYGKGRIQAVYELDDGSGLFVTIAKYFSPHLHAIDKVGVRPDRVCRPEPTGVVRMGMPMLIGGSSKSQASAIESDHCIQMAERALGLYQRF
eukprot:jgi/Mesvir1/6569/Mv16826-RA.1